MAAPDPIPDLLKAANDASGKAFALWITFLTAGTYLAISIGTTTDAQLLVEGPVKLPLLGVDMPLFDFYVFAPPLFVVLHLYVLMQLYLLAATLRLFDLELQNQQMIKKDRQLVSSQLDKFLFTQLLINKPEAWMVRQFLRVVVWLSFVVGPIALLLAFQLRFLPYHSVLGTGLHRGVLVLDVILLLLMWPKISAGGTRPACTTFGMRYAWRAILGVFCLLIFVFSFGVATIPDEALDRASALRRYLPAFEHNLHLANAILVEPDRDKLSKLERTLSLRGRDLRYAHLSNADLRKSDLSEADLSSADLRGAGLSDVDLRDANLSNAKLAHADLSRAKLSNSNLTRADLTSADLRADLTGADLRGATLRNADLTGANLIHADLTNANMTGAELTEAKLTGANLSSADLSNADPSLANLAHANLTRVNLTHANLSGTDLSATDLRDADLTGANLFGANLTDAKLDKARLIRANLSGADLTRANLTGADLSGADLSRTNVSDTAISSAQLDAACGANAGLEHGRSLKPCPERK